MRKDPREIGFRYSDILYQAHHRCANRPHMGLRERAAIFAPFAALTGYEEAVRETARYTTKRRELTEEEKQRLNEHWSEVQQRLAEERKVEQGKAVPVRLTYFVADAHKSGGSYQSETVEVIRLRLFERQVVLSDGRRLPLDDVVEVEVETESSASSAVK